MNSVFLLWHTRELPGGAEDSRLLGVYSSKQLAEKKIEEKYRAGAAGQEDFVIDEYEVEDDWGQSFASVPNIYGSA